ncbi:xanthine dehydrogenase C subunit [Paenibacillus sp. V4I9]|uniref:FAD binding domain-containing protein n=1 Tax=Paenibacillus sp. V4I9 TaxID=3042308 RepID=UPI00277D1A49|nr:FAD binding domain-containing protein [Paenibacillus sp. V4I9]MDQ0884935.1 xanthine dehydrogenase C subunit [Paenibacillus sp. V4I9]
MSVPLYQLPEQQPSVWQPTSVAEAMRMKHKWGDDSVLIAGGTWLRTRWENGLSPLPQHLISLGNISLLSGLTVDFLGHIHIGPALCLADLMKNELVRQRCGLLVQACSEIAAPSVRNLATIGGNVMSRTGDLIPVLLVMDAQIICSDGQNERSLALTEWLESPISSQNEVMTGIVVPTAAPLGVEEENKYEFYLKVGRREAFTPSVVTVAGRLSLGKDGALTSIALAAGGGSAVPARFKDLEAAAMGQPLSKELLKYLHKGLLTEFDAVADDYAGVTYRKQTAANLIVSECYKAWQKGGGADAPKS